ncbi:MAG: hypothetical protein IRZ03_18550 [Acidobacterium ailaaui]|nr:hypothetical protein [Pseudacidobacterium ailaaui]
MTRLVNKIAREYERKGYSKKRAREIALATVYGKIEPRMKKARQKRAKR